MNGWGISIWRPYFSLCKLVWIQNLSTDVDRMFYRVIQLRMSAVQPVLVPLFKIAEMLLYAYYYWCIKILNLYCARITSY